MGEFLESEKRRQEQFKATSHAVTEHARAAGIYRKRLRPFCLPLDLAEENLFSEIRQPALAYFRDHHIRWHDGTDGKPSNHLCSSQVCCVNFLMPFADKPDTLAALFGKLFPGIRRAMPVEQDRFVAFEWIGACDYLHEARRGAGRTRGALVTSADAAILFERMDGKRQFVLIEWKYTESYGKVDKTISQSGTDRTAIYRPLLERQDCPIDCSALPGVASLFFEPFYQLMRLQLFAHEMEKAGELGADLASVVHITPRCNTDFDRVTSPGLAKLGETPTSIWSKLVRVDERFHAISTERLFGEMLTAPPTELHAWSAYVGERYGWANGGRSMPRELG